MKTELVITDVTRMQEGRVCIAGYDRKKKCVRPTLPPPGIHESSLYSKAKPIVFPFAVVEFDLLEPVPQPPHTEDWRYAPKSVRFVKKLDEAEKQETLERLCEPNVTGIFGTPIYSDFGFYVMDGRGERSLGTICPNEITDVIYKKKEDKWDYHLHFSDANGNYRLAITDLAWRYYCDGERKAGKSSEKIAADLLSELNSSQTFLRIGLARGWSKFPGRCYLQITGVYTFPDYLDGRTFADFASSENQSSIYTPSHDRADFAERPSSQDISAKLDTLVEIQSAADLARADYEAKRATILAKVQLELDALESEYAPLLLSSSERAESIIAEIKDDVLRYGASVHSNTVRAVYSKGRISWDSKALGQYALGHPDVLEYRKQGAPTVSIRYVKKRE